MPRTDIASQAAPGQYPAAGVAITFTAADVANQNSFVSTGRELLIAFNSDVSSHNVTVLSASDSFGRKGDITSEAIAAGAYKIYGPLAKTGWADSTGAIEFGADNAGVKFAVIQLPF